MGWEDLALEAKAEAIMAKRMRQKLEVFSFNNDLKKKKEPVSTNYQVNKECFSDEYTIKV